MTEHNLKPESELPIITGLLGIAASIAMGLPTIINPEETSIFFCCPSIIFLLISSASFLKFIKLEK